MGEHIVEKTDLPDELISQAAGSLGFQDTQPRVCTCITSLFEIRTVVEAEVEVKAQSGGFTSSICTELS